MCPEHKKKYAMEFLPCPHYPEDGCECISRDNGEEDTYGYWHCAVCARIEEKKRDALLKETTNIVVLAQDVILYKKRKIVSFTKHPFDVRYYNMLHGGKHVRKGSFAKINLLTGYIEKCKKEEANFFVVK